MAFWLLQAFTAVRLFGCAPLWLWCWWRRPRGMVAWMALAAMVFLFSDHFDGLWARAWTGGDRAVSILGFHGDL